MIRYNKIGGIRSGDKIKYKINLPEIILSCMYKITYPIFSWPVILLHSMLYLILFNIGYENFLYLTLHSRKLWRDNWRSCDSLDLGWCVKALQDWGRRRKKKNIKAQKSNSINAKLPWKMLLYATQFQGIRSCNTISHWW